MSVKNVDVWELPKDWEPQTIKPEDAFSNAVQIKLSGETILAQHKLAGLVCLHCGAVQSAMVPKCEACGKPDGLQTEG